MSHIRTLTKRARRSVAAIVTLAALWVVAGAPIYEYF